MSRLETPQYLRNAKQSLAPRILKLMKKKIGELAYVIAVVDDDQRFRRSLGNLLESAGHCVRLFDSADEFLQAKALTQVDALISDIRMPGVDGIELQRRVGIMRPKLPVFLITACSDTDPVANQQANNRGLFRKPVDGAELLKAIGAVLKGMA